MMRTLFILCFILAGIFPSSAYAVSLYMDPGEINLQRGDSEIISLRLDTDASTCINAIDATIRFSKNIQIIDTSRGESILSIWLEDPVIDRVNRTITFVGGIPNGYCGRVDGDPRLTNVLLNLVIMSPGMQVGAAEGGNIASIEFGDETRVMLNDGFGTEADRALYGAAISLDRTPTSNALNPWLETVNEDDTPPQPFTISLQKDPSAYSGQYFIVFNTTDKQSGISHYEVMEEPLEFLNSFRWGAADAPWIQVRSPYVLQDQSLNSTIRVRAIDKAGNEYVSVLIPDAELRSFPLTVYSLLLIALALLILLGMVTLVVVLLRRRKQNIDGAERIEEPPNDI